MTLPHAISEAMPSRADLIPLLEKDLGEVAAFIAAQSDRRVEIVAPHLQWFWLENPARQPDGPLGFGLRSDGRLVGCILCSPQAFRFENRKLILMGSSSFYVEGGHRGHGGRIFLQYSRLGSKWPLFGTSANIQAAALWKACGATPIPYSDGELFGVLRWPPLAEEFAHRKLTNRTVSRLAGTVLPQLARIFRPLKIDTGLAGVLHVVSSPEQVNDLPIHESSTKLTALRDPNYIRWRYFSGRDSTTEVFAFRSRQPDREILVTVNQRTRGYRSQINTLNILDVYPEVPAAEWLRIVGALIGRYRSSVDAIVLRGQDSERTRLFRARGFQERAFEAPNGWFLDKADLLPSLDWYPVPADGDGLI
ncbi:MAG: hypothetical protein WBX38_05785 [Candidatus Sulfotelmatobacter sp.]